MGRILVVGYRQGLAQVLEQQSLDFILWSGKELKNPPAFGQLVDLPWPSNPKQARELFPMIKQRGPFQAIIAGTERSIPLVAALRRAFNLEKTTAMNLMRCHDKLLMKTFLKAHGIPLNPYLWGPRLDANTIWQTLGSKIVCKDRSESGGRSIRIYTNKTDLQAELAKKQRLFERFNPNPEYSVESFIQDGKIGFTNITQYYLRQHINLLPAVLPSSALATILALNEQVIRLLGLQRGMTHMELYLGPEGPVFGEIAIRPPGGYIMELLDLAYGISAWQCYLDIELGRRCAFPSQSLQAAAVHVLHPGRGIVRAIAGWPAVRRHPSVQRAKLKVAVGDSIKLRVGVGEDVGFVVQTGADVPTLIPAVEEIRQLLHWTMDDRKAGLQSP